MMESDIKEISIPKTYKMETLPDGIEYHTPWREYECVDGNHKLFVFSSR